MYKLTLNVLFCNEIDVIVKAKIYSATLFKVIVVVSRENLYNY
jgi:hypothetical protein